MSELLIYSFSKFLNTKIFIILLFIIILIIISYKLYKKNINDTYIENFSLIKKLKKSSKNNITNILKKNNSNNLNNSNKSKLKNNFKNISNKNKETTFNELMNKSEAFTKEKDKLLSFTDTIEKYKKSFNHKKFKNNSKNTAESFEKFALYKEKFFDLFK